PCPERPSKAYRSSRVRLLASAALTSSSRLLPQLPHMRSGLAERAATACGRRGGRDVDWQCQLLQEGDTSDPAVRLRVAIVRDPGSVFVCRHIAPRRTGAKSP